MNLTFVIPAFGKSEFLEECLHSLSIQTYPCKIVITTSNYSDWLAELAVRNGIDLINHSNGGSIANDWNFAINFPSSDIVVLAHQDDVYHPSFAMKIVEFLTHHPNVGFVFTDAYELTDCKISKYNLRILVKKILIRFGFFGKKSIRNHSEFWRLLSFGCPIPCPSVAYRPSLLGTFAFSDNFSVNLDWDAWSRLGFHGVCCGYINEYLMTHRIHSSSETQKAIESNVRYDEDIRIFKRYWPGFITNILVRLYRIGY